MSLLEKFKSQKEGAESKSAKEILKEAVKEALEEFLKDHPFVVFNFNLSLFPGGRKCKGKEVVIVPSKIQAGLQSGKEGWMIKKTFWMCNNTTCDDKSCPFNKPPKEELAQKKKSST